MDKEMEQIAWNAFKGPSKLPGVLAACEAVLAEQKRREAQQEIDATTVRHPAQQASLGELTPDELSRFRQRLNVPAELVRQQPAEDVVQRMRDAVTGMRGMAAALAVAREGMVPASEMERVEKKLINMTESAAEYFRRAHTAEQQLEGMVPVSQLQQERDTNAAAFEGVTQELRKSIDSFQQQLSTMYSLEQVEKAMRKYLHADVNTPQIDAILKSLTAPQQPTEQEKVEAVLRSHGFVARTAQDFVDAIAELAALGKGGK